MRAFFFIFVSIKKNVMSKKRFACSVVFNFTGLFPYRCFLGTPLKHRQRRHFCIKASLR